MGFNGQKLLRWIQKLPLFFILKVEKIFKCSLDSISSPSFSLKIQILDGKVCLRCKGKTFLGIVNFLYTKVCWQHPAKYCLHTFPTDNSNFYWRWRWWDQIQAMFSNLFYFISSYILLLALYLQWKNIF